MSLCFCLYVTSGAYGLFVVDFYGKLVRKYQWFFLFLVPVRGGRWHIIPQLAVPLILYSTYIYIAFWWIICYLLREPETTIENIPVPWDGMGIEDFKLVKSRGLFFSKDNQKKTRVSPEVFLTENDGT